MKNNIFLLTLIAAITTISTYGQDPKEITQKATDVSDIDAMEMITTLKIFDPKGRQRVREMSAASKKFGETTKMITKFISPAEVKGIGILIFDHPDKDDDMWIYLPALRKTRRIVSSEKSKSYMGSEFSNADMSKPNIDDFNYELLGSATHESVDCWRVASIPKDENIEDKFGFSKKITLIDKQNYRVKKIDFYDLNRELHKVMVFSDYEELGPGKALAKKMEIENLQNNRRSVLTMDKIQVGSNLDENTFTVGMLEK